MAKKQAGNATAASRESATATVGQFPLYGLCGNFADVWYIIRMPHFDAFPVQLGDRGRLVLPAAIRKRLRLREGDELLVTVQPDGSLRLTSPRQAVRETRGLYRARAGGRSLSDELIAERRAEVKRETSKS